MQNGMVGKCDGSTGKCEYMCGGDTKACAGGCIPGASECCEDRDCKGGTAGHVGRCDSSNHRCSFPCADGTSECDGVCTSAGQLTRSCTPTPNCGAGTQRCANGTWGTCTPARTPTTEVCNGQDDDCDGKIDDGDLCGPNQACKNGTCVTVCDPKQGKSCGECHVYDCSGQCTGSAKDGTSCGSSGCPAKQCKGGQCILGAKNGCPNGMVCTNIFGCILNEKPSKGDEGCVPCGDEHGVCCPGRRCNEARLTCAFGGSGPNAGEYCTDCSAPNTDCNAGGSCN
jgi:Notch-like protein